MAVLGWRRRSSAHEGSRVSLGNNSSVRKTILIQVRPLKDRILAPQLPKLFQCGLARKAHTPHAHPNIQDQLMTPIADHPTKCTPEKTDMSRGL